MSFRIAVIAVVAMAIIYITVIPSLNMGDTPEPDPETSEPSAAETPEPTTPVEPTEPPVEPEEAEHLVEPGAAEPPVEPPTEPAALPERGSSLRQSRWGNDWFDPIADRIDEGTWVAGNPQGSRGGWLAWTGPGCRAGPPGRERAVVVSFLFLHTCNFFLITPYNQTGVTIKSPYAFVFNNEYRI